jgi:hypothetical protein
MTRTLSLLLTTAYAVRRDLGSTYEYLLQRDPLRAGRRQRNVLKDAPQLCAACGKPEVELQVAHIKALELGSETVFENLVRLCHEPRRNGCHELYDSGYASPREMREAQGKWLRGEIDNTLRPTMESRRNAGDEIERCKREGQLRKALRCVEDRLRHTADDVQALRLRIKALELERRRTSKDALQRADRIFTELSKRPSLPQQLRSWLFYEGGYVALLMGQQEIARTRFEEGLAATDRSAPGWEWKCAAATAKIVHTAVAALGAKSPWDKLYADLTAAASLADAGHDADSRRWALNCRWNTARLFLARGDLTNAEAVWRSAADIWESVTVETGWDVAVHWSAVAIRGQIAALQATTASRADEALRHLARAIVATVGRAGRYPEGIRDTLFALARVFDLLGASDHSICAREVALRTQDGTSWLCPFRA